MSFPPDPIPPPPLCPVCRKRPSTPGLAHGWCLECSGADAAKSPVDRHYDQRERFDRVRATYLAAQCRAIGLRSARIDGQEEARRQAYGLDIHAAAEMVSKLDRDEVEAWVDAGEAAKAYRATQAEVAQESP